MTRARHHGDKVEAGVAIGDVNNDGDDGSGVVRRSTSAGRPLTIMATDLGNVLALTDAGGGAGAPGLR